MRNADSNKSLDSYIRWRFPLQVSEARKSISVVCFLVEVYTGIMRVLLFVVFLGTVSGQDRALAPLARGVWQEWVGSETNGSFLFKTTDELAHRCAFTSKTYFEREHKRTWVSRIESGQQVEVLSERLTGGTRCRALIVRVLTPKALESPRYKWRSWQSAAEIVAPRGNVLLTGIVLEHDEYSMRLRTRDGARHLITLRADTRFTNSGAASVRTELPAHQPIQVRISKSYDNKMEAFSIVWGEILRPQRH